LKGAVFAEIDSNWYPHYHQEKQKRIKGCKVHNSESHLFSLGINEITEPSFTKVTKKILKKNKILMNRK